MYMYLPIIQCGLYFTCTTYLLIGVCQLFALEIEIYYGKYSSSMTSAVVK